MDLILHITTESAWQAALRAGVYAPPSLATEGFIHCSTPAQTAETANLFFRGQPGLVLLCIDSSRLSSELKYESPTDAAARPRAGSFPHIYGMLELSAVVAVVPFPPDPDGSFCLPRLPPELGTR
jgi:uncharacterized protein (DUF952 family)